MILYIKNMVCRRCKMVVKSELEKPGIQLPAVNLGEVETIEPVSEKQKSEIPARLKEFGFERINDKKSQIITKIKTLIIGALTKQPTRHQSFHLFIKPFDAKLYRSEQSFF